LVQYQLSFLCNLLCIACKDISIERSMRIPMRNYLIHSLIIGIALVAGSWAADVNNIAVMEMEGKGISAQEASVLTDKLRGELINTGKFQVIERSMMDQILKEQGFQQTGCTSNECAVQIGQLIGVTQMIAGSVGKIESTYLISIRLIDVATGKIAKNVQQEVTGTLTEVLKKSIPQIALEMAGVELKPSVDTTAKQPAPSTTDPVSVTPAATRVEKKTKPVAAGKNSIVVGGGYTAAIGWMHFSAGTQTIPAHGGNLRFGIMFKNKNYLGLEGTVAVGQNKVTEAPFGYSYGFVHSVLIGAGIVYYYEGLVFSDILTLAPGLIAGFWSTTDKFDTTGGQHTAMEFGGVKLKIKVGRNVFHWFADGVCVAGPEWEDGNGQGYHNRISPILMINTGVELKF
jgi:hypothetical protein